MNYFFSFLLLQACASLRFNDVLDFEEAADHDDEGRRRRRRRRRRRGPGVPTNGAAPFSFATRMDFNGLDPIFTASQTDSAQTARCFRGWLMVMTDGATADVTVNDHWIWRGAANFLVDHTKWHSFGTEIAASNLAHNLLFIGLSRRESATAMETNAHPVMGMGFGNTEAGGTALNFYSSKVQGARIAKAVNSKLVGAVATAYVMAATTKIEPFILDAATAVDKSVKLGWTYIPAGMWGVQAVALQTGVFRMYTDGVQTDDHAATTTLLPTSGVGLEVTIGSTAKTVNQAVHLFVNYVNVQGAP